jgi:ADP-ribosyl-[dinitrogen reductase] hydrolase
MRDGDPEDAADRAVGSLVAGAVGDALGAPVEFLDIAAIRRRYGVVGLTDYDVAYGRRGAFTDDTQMMLFTAEALSAAPAEGQRQELLRAAYLSWLDTQEGGPAWGPGLFGVAGLHSRRAPGSTCLSALHATRAGARGTVDRPINGSKGCGGVMRAAPAGVVAADPAEAFAIGCELAALTHGHPSGYLPAGVLAVAVHLSIAGEALDAALDAAVAHARGHPAHAETVDAVEAGRALAGRGRPEPEELESLGGGWTGEEALAIAVAAALSGTDLADALLLAVNHSGDSDSTGMLCGNLLGARDGLAAVPQGWLHELELRDLVIATATALAQRARRRTGGAS